MPLPPLDEASTLLEHYFTTFNRFLPLFDEAALMSSFHDKHATLESCEAELWAAVNVIFALSHQLIAMHSGSTGFDHETTACGFLRNAISVVDELSIQTPTMLSAQALVGIAKVLHSTSFPNTATVYLAMASRHMYSLGMHRPCNEASPGSESLEWRRRLLWMAYSIDKDFSLRLDQPPILNDQEIDPTLPEWDPKDGLGFIPSVSGGPRINFFRLHANLAIVQSKIYSRLYSGKALQQQDHDFENREPVCDLVKVLKTWRNQIPVEFHPESILEQFPPTSVIPMVILYLRYFNCLTMVLRLAYWKVGHLEAYKSSLEDPHPCQSQTLCIQVARRALLLFNVLPHGNVPCMWLVIVPANASVNTDMLSGYSVTTSFPLQ